MPVTEKPDPFAYLKPYERAARIYCERASIVADLEVACKHPTLGKGRVFRKQWHLIAEDMIDLTLKLAAMRQCANEPLPME